MKKKMRVYQDRGVGALSYNALCSSLKKSPFSSLFEIEKIGAEEVKIGAWRKECALFIMPGGRDEPYHEALKGIGNQHLKEYVKQGGSFLGLCAGAYFGSAEIFFEMGTSHEISSQRELSFFPGKAVGTLFPEKKYSYQGHFSAKATPISFEDKILFVYYNGGCTFVDANLIPSVSILAYYQETPIPLPAIIECRVDKGLALLSGVHIEMEAKYFQSEKSLYPQLFLDEKKREELFIQLLARLLPLL